ncbi:MAG: hypothetical protein AAFP90_22965, partial [Planctomycetota bacterium]
MPPVDQNCFHAIAFRTALGLLLFLVCGQSVSAQQAADDVIAARMAEAAAVRAAAQRVAPAIVRIEVVGVLESQGEVSADAPSVGTIVRSDGYIL